MITTISLTALSHKLQTLDLWLNPIDVVHFEFPSPILRNTAVVSSYQISLNANEIAIQYFFKFKTEVVGMKILPGAPYTYLVITIP